VKFLRSESEVFGLEGHLVATNALYVIAVEMPTMPMDVEESRSEVESRQDAGGNTMEDERSEEMCDMDEETYVTEFESEAEEDEENEDDGSDEEIERKKMKRDEGQSSEEVEFRQDERSNNGEQLDEHPAKDGDTEPKRKSEDEKNENEYKRKKSQESSVHFYVGQTLRNVVKRCEGHCKNVIFLLEEAINDIYTKFEDYECADHVKKVMLVDAYLAAAKAVAIAHPPATFRCAVIVVRHFVDRKAELIRRFGLTDMKQGFNGGQSIQTMITDFFSPTTNPRDDPGHAEDIKTEDTETEDKITSIEF